jgi:hydroxycarboxylate dehydrogenase B
VRLDPDSRARETRIASVTEFLRAAQPQDPASPVRAPGDVERELRVARQIDGIPLDDETWRQIRDAAASFGIDAGRV